MKNSIILTSRNIGDYRLDYVKPILEVVLELTNNPIKGNPKINPRVVKEMLSKVLEIKIPNTVTKVLDVEVKLNDDSFNFEVFEHEDSFRIEDQNGYSTFVLKYSRDLAKHRN